MSDKTAIEWTDATWNPIRGCSRVSEGCRHCYAERVAARFSGPGLAYEGLARFSPNGPRWTGAVRLIEKHLGDPLQWKRPRRVFDLFHEKLPDTAIDRIFAVMAIARQHTFQVLTKRPERMRRYLEQIANERDMQRWVNAAAEWFPDGYDGPAFEWPLPNVWLGVSAENQETADGRIPLLLQTPAAVRFVSAEPLLGTIDFRRFMPTDPLLEAASGELDGQRSAPSGRDCPRGTASRDNAGGLSGAPIRRREPQLDWIIAGGESGPGARPMGIAWARQMRDQCQAAGTAFFFKQWGGPRPKSRGRKLDGRTWDEFPNQ